MDPDFSVPIGKMSLAEPAADASASLSYEPFYKLREKPFSLSADPRFLFKSTAHAPAFNALLAGIRRREGLIVLTGEIGSGKTMLCRSVLKALDRRTFSAFVPDPFVSREDLLKTLLIDFGVVSIADLKSGRLNAASRLDLSYLLYEFLDSLVPLQAFAVLIIDEAQNLTVPLLEEIRILSEVERREKLLQVVLVGQPELSAKLKLPEMRQVNQRVSVRCELGPLDARSVAAYVQHRLQVAGDGGGQAEFTPAALAAVFQGSAGLPRLINRICDRALQRGYDRRALVIEPTLVRTVIDDLGLAPVPATPPEQSLPRGPGQSPSRAAAANVSALAARRAASPASIRGASPRAWPRVAAGLLAAAAVLTGGGWWYVSAQRVDTAQLAAILPAAPGRQPMPPALAPVPPVAAAAAAIERDAAPAPIDQGDYLIQVALFASRERAGQLVSELTNAGFRAREVERDFGPRRGRLWQVIVGGYNSALAVEHDLRRIRELPDYGDAYLLARQEP